MKTDCDQCYQKSQYVDGEFSNLYGYSGLVLAKATLIAGLKKQPERVKKETANVIRTRHGITPEEINPQLFENGHCEY